VLAPLLLPVWAMTPSLRSLSKVIKLTIKI
jgi:hypothetical protein